MQHSLALIIAALAVFANSTPLVLRQGQICDRAPSGGNRSSAPIGQPAAATADVCRQQCGGNPQCQSFVFGLPHSDNSPKCMLFAVPASEVAPQEQELHVFDKGCTGVPNKAATH